MTRLTVPVAQRLEHSGAEQVRRNHDKCIRELQELPIASAQVIKDVEITDGAFVRVSHGLGRVPHIVLVSPPRNPTTTGRVVEVRDGFDRTKAVEIHASGWGATITVDVLVF